MDSSSRRTRLGLVNLRVFRAFGPRWSARLQAGHVTIPCAIGKAGLSALKREGDHATPLGIFRLRIIHYRPDRLARPLARLKSSPLKPDSGWCDDAASPNYNRFLRLPSTDRHEVLFREDGLYDVVIVLDFNLQPRKRGRGSANSSIWPVPVAPGQKAA